MRYTPEFGKRIVASPADLDKQHSDAGGDSEGEGGNSGVTPQGGKGRFVKQVGVEQVQDKGGRTFAEEKTENVVAVMAGVFESYFYFVQIAYYIFKSLKKQVEAIQVIVCGI